jgi:dihydrofolate reductase
LAAPSRGTTGINKATKYVVSNTLTTHDWSKSVFLKGNVVDEIKKLKQQDGPDLQVHGSSNLIQTLLRHDLIDEFWLKVFPVTLGPGKRLFGEGTMPAAFKVSETSFHRPSHHRQLRVREVGWSSKGRPFVGLSSIH